jgi:hypothetical protein
MADEQDKKAAAGYLAEMVQEMRTIAERHDLKTLSYLLGLAAADAAVLAGRRDDVSGQGDPARPAEAGCDTPEEHR